MALLERVDSVEIGHQEMDPCTAYKASASTAFPTEVAGKVGHCKCISLRCSLYTHVEKDNSMARYYRVIFNDLLNALTNLMVMAYMYMEELPING